MQNIKTSLISTLALVVMLFGVSSAAHAKVDRVSSDWMLKTPATINFVCGGGSYVHTLHTVVHEEGHAISGMGHYNPDNSYTWDMDGEIVDNTISMTILYTGTASGSIYNLVGTIAQDGSISGTVDSNCETFTMEAGTASRFEGNHGAWVSSSENKREVAQSRVGMPVKSKGHTK